MSPVPAPRARGRAFLEYLQLPPGPIAAPTIRTRSIWLNQLVLAASVVVISVVILAVTPELFAEWSVATAVTGIILLSLVALAVPWASVASAWVLVLPFGDLICLSFMALASDLRTGLLWMFPTIWIGTYFSLIVLATGLATIGASLLVVWSLSQTNISLVRLSLILVTATFIGLSAHLAARRNRAFRELLRRQAGRLRATTRRAARSEARTTELLNALEEAIAALDSTGALVTVNQAFAELFGVSPLDLTQPPRSVEYDGTEGSPIPERDRPVNRAARGEEFSDLRVWIFGADGTWRDLAVTAKRLGETDGPSGAASVLIARDVTDIAAAQRDRERLTAIASHEMRHPLSAILGNAELALDNDDLSDTTRDRMEIIHTSSEQLLQLIAGLRADAKTSPDRRAVERGPVDLKPVIVGSVDSFAATADAAAIAIASRVEPQLLVQADAFRLRQVFDNLMSNAIKYTGEGGRVVVSGLRVADGVRVSITDTGIGMSPREVQRAFEPYFRAEGARGIAPGTGLGLSISREIVEQQGGRLEVHSRLGEGTTFALTLPLAGENG
jgi:PAS domain S-box-containing protein